MSKPVKNLIIANYKDRFGDLDGAVLVDIRGVQSNENNNLRNGLAQKKIRVTVVQNNLAREALKGTGIERISELFEGPTAMVYGGDSVVEVAREILEQVKKLPKLQVKGALMEGELFGPDQIEALSKYPTRDEAQAQVIQVILSAAGQVIGAATGIGGQIASIIEQIEKKHEEKGAT
jgi:large subunit ribosomal protein L10